MEKRILVTFTRIYTSVSHTIESNKSDYQQSFYVEQIETIGNNTRDPSGWSITVLYFALLALSEAKPDIISVDAVRWATLREARKLGLAFDHLALLNKAIERLRSKVSYTTLPLHILPREFTLAEHTKCVRDHYGS